MLVSLLCASCWSRQAYKLGVFMDVGRTLWVGDGTAVAHPLQIRLRWQHSSWKMSLW